MIPKITIPSLQRTSSSTTDTSITSPKIMYSPQGLLCSPVAYKIEESNLNKITFDREIQTPNELYDNLYNYHLETNPNTTIKKEEFIMSLVFSGNIDNYNIARSISNNHKKRFPSVKSPIDEKQYFVPI